MRKAFDELTIVDDYMFCTVMQDPTICKMLLNSVLSDSVGSIKRIEYQRTLNSRYKAKSIRLDVVAYDDQGRLYDIEMQVCNQYNVAKRMRYYQSAMDVAYLDKGNDYIDLPKTFIIFFCLFDPFNCSLPVYTFKNYCKEHTDIELHDDITKIVVNSLAGKKAENKNLQDFLELMNGNRIDKSKFINLIEQKICTIKQTNERREEYMMLSTVEMDARREGILAGISQGISQGLSQGFSQGVAKTALALKQMGMDFAKISEVTGLSIKEIQELK